MITSGQGGSVGPARRELVERISQSEGLALIEAPWGFGKSTLTAKVAQANSTTVVGGNVHGGDGSFDLAAHWAATGRPEVLVVDDPTPQLLQQVVEWRAPPRLVLVASTDLADAAFANAAVRVDAHDLLLTVDDVELAAADAHGRLPPRVIAHVVMAQSGGWAAHSFAALSASTRAGDDGSGELAEMLASHPRVTRLADHVARFAGQSATEGLARLALLDRFPEEAAVALLGRHDFTVLRRAGFPLFPRSDGWMSIVPLVRERLRRHDELDESTARLVAPLLVARGGAFIAARTLLAAGAATAAADALCTVPGTAIDTVSQAEASALFRTLRSRVPGDARLAFRHARVYRNLAQFEEQAQAIAAAIELATASGDEATAWAAEAEDLLRSIGRLERSELERRVASLEQRVGGDDTAATITLRCREVRAALLAESESLTEINRSVDQLTEIAVQWEHHGDQATSAATLRLLAAGPLSHLGRYGEAVAHLERARQMLPDHLFSRALTSELLCRFHALCGDHAAFEATLPEATTFATAVRLSWLTGYLSWATMLGTALDGDVDAAVHACLAAESNLGELLDHSTGAVFLAEAASTFAVLGADDRARDLLARAMRRRDQNELEVGLAEVVVLCRTGDPAEALTRGKVLLDDDRLPTGRRWRVTLELQVAEARAAGAAVDLKLVPATVPPELGPGGSCLHLVVESGHQEDVTAAETDLDLRLFGELRLSSGDGELATPPGQAGTLLKILALHGVELPIDRIVDWLWPDADLVVGRRRLKNIVRRLRASLVDDVVIRRSETVALGSNVRTDLDRFRVAARRATETSGSEPALAVASAIEALTLYTAEVLAADAYAEWAADERNSIRARARSLLDIVLESPAGPRIGPSWLLETAIRLEVSSDITFLRIAGVARGAGSEETARAATEWAEAIASGLGLISDIGR
ncbi:MAG: hypothetical protein ACFCVK_10075 [Acidimicrobiales bacterium]